MPGWKHLNTRNTAQWQGMTSHTGGIRAGHARGHAIQLPAEVYADRVPVYAAGGGLLTSFSAGDRPHSENGEVSTSRCRGSE